MEIEDTDSISDNYLFDKTIAGYVPAIIEINNRGEEEYEEITTEKKNVD